MENPPREVLRVPERMPPLPKMFSFLKLEDLGLLTEGEEAFGQHLQHSVQLLQAHKYTIALWCDCGCCSGNLYS